MFGTALLLDFAADGSRHVGLHSNVAAILTGMVIPPVRRRPVVGPALRGVGVKGKEGEVVSNIDNRRV